MHRRSGDSGFGLVEIVIALFLLGIIAVAILPVMINGIRYSSEQSAVATATRQLNSLMDEARTEVQTAQNCDPLTAAAADHTFTDGAGHSFKTSGIVASPCNHGEANHITLTAVTQSGESLATVVALVYVP